MLYWWRPVKTLIYRPVLKPQTTALQCPKSPHVSVDGWIVSSSPSSVFFVGLFFNLYIVFYPGFFFFIPEYFIIQKLSTENKSRHSFSLCYISGKSPWPWHSKYSDSLENIILQKLQQPFWLRILTTFWQQMTLATSSNVSKAYLWWQPPLCGGRQTEGT